MDKLLNDRMGLYLKTDGYELETKFGTKRNITRQEFDSVIACLKGKGFCSARGKYHLNIQNEFFNEKSGGKKMSNIRTEINGITNIQKFCKTGTIKTLLKEIVFRQKTPLIISGERVPPLDYSNFGFRIPE